MNYSNYQQKLIWNAYNLNDNINLEDISSFNIIYPIIKKNIFSKTTIIFFSKNIHYLYLNNYNNINNNYFYNNINLYKKEILLLLKIKIINIKNEDNPLKLTKNDLLLKYSNNLDENIFYIGYQIDNYIFYGLNEKSLILTENLINTKFNINFKIILFTNEENEIQFKTNFKYLFNINKKKNFIFSNNFFNLLSLSTE